MTARFQRIRDIIEEALTKPSAERDAYVRDACASDEMLLREVRKLLVAPVTEVQDLLERRVPQMLSDSRSEFSEGSIPGLQLDGFTLIEEIGRGGSGVVYRATQLEPIQRDVAVKILHLRPGREHFLRRFEAEKQVLALLEHPNLASLYDAGTTTDGLPWFAMELVHGTPITDYLAAHELMLQDRLRLYVDVCSAVDYAHRKGILHRDLKPTNILVSEDEGQRTAKVIDFGIARTLAGASIELSLMTMEGEALGTPLYMSPEQARGELQSVDTRSDVFSLGVVLHQILTSQLPYLDAGPSLLGVLRTVAHGRVEVQDKLWDGSPMPADLRAILRVCLDPDPERRYAGARSLADDLERFLARRPVAAQPPSTMYQLRMVVRRNRAASAALSLLLIGLVASSVVISTLYGRQIRALHAAEREQLKAETINGFLADVLVGIQRDTNLDLGQLRSSIEKAVQPVLDRPNEDAVFQADLIDLVTTNVAVLNERQTSTQLRRESARARVDAILEQEPNMASTLQGVLERIKPDAIDRDLIARARGLPAPSSTVGRQQLIRLAQTLQLLAYDEFALGRYRTARNVAVEALAVHRTLQSADRSDESFALKILGESSRALGELDLAAKFHVESAELDREIFGPESARYGTSAVLVGRLELSRLDWDGANTWLSRSESIFRRLLATDDPRPLDRHNLRMVLQALGRARMGLGHLDAARVAIEESLELSGQARAEDISYATCLIGLVDLNICEGETQAGIESARLAVRTCEDYPEEPLRALQSWNALGRAQCAAGHWSDAEESFIHAIDVTESNDLQAPLDLAEARAGCGWARLHLGRSAAAAEDLRVAAKLRRAGLGPQHWEVMATEALEEIAMSRVEARSPDLSPFLPRLRQRMVPPLGPLLMAELEQLSESDASGRN